MGADNSPLSKSQVYLLERIGFAWESSRNASEWQGMYDELVQFRNEHGQMQVKKLEYPSLYSWILLQRWKYTGGGTGVTAEMPHQIMQLEKIGFGWAGEF